MGARAVLFNIISKLVKSMTAETILLIIFISAISYFFGQTVGRFDMRQQCEQERLKEENAHKKLVIEQSKKYEQELQTLEEKYKNEIKELNAKFKRDIKNIKSSNIASVECVFDLSGAKQGASADQNKCPFLCYRREELLRRIKETLAIGRECEEEHRRIKYLYENCVKNVSTR